MSALSGWISNLRAIARRLAIGLSALLALTIISGSCAAQQLSAAEREALQARKEALFQQMLRNPANLDITFAYADVSAKLGDNEAAVSALERMLLFNPNLPRVQLELGALYFRMGSYELARTYFEKALAANPPAEVKQRVNTYLAEITRLSSRQHFSGYLFFGGQYQSDANLGGSSFIPLTGTNALFPFVVLNPEFAKKADANIFATSSVLYSYDLGTQNRDSFEIGGTGFANHYGDVDRLDLGLVEATAGPRFNFPTPLPQVSTASLKPYLIVNDVSLGGNQYFHTIGFGGEATALAWNDVNLKSVFEFRVKNFNNAPDRPLSRGLNGSDKLFSLFADKPIALIRNSDLAVEFDYLNQDTRLAFFSNNTYALSGAYRIRYDDPTHYLHLPWETTVFLTSSWADYQAADRVLSNSPRFERRWRFGLTQSIGITANIALVLQVQRDIVASNLPIFSYTSNSILLGPQIRF